MAGTVKNKREYRSTRRQEQARQTRIRIIEAARRLFTERGYSGATIEAIAAEAGVAVETVYAIFGAKLEIIKALVQVSVTGDDLPIPLLQRPEVLAVRELASQQAVVEKWAGDIARIMSRMGAVFAILNSAAPLEPEIAALLDKILQDRLAGIGFFVDQLIRTGPLRQGLGREQAVDTAWAVSSAEVYNLLTIRRGWDQVVYTRWLAGSAARLLLPT